MTYHVLNGDCLADTFSKTSLKGEIIVCRECLIEGNLEGNSLQEFWQARAKFLQVTVEEYQQKSIAEFEKIMFAPQGSEFNLWFGYDLFCQANMWFVLSLIYELSAEKKVYVVYPSFLGEATMWKEFGNATEQDLNTSLENRVLFGKTDLQLAKDLWTAYKTHNLDKLERLSYQQSSSFPYLQIVCKAHIDRFPLEGKNGRPETVIEELIKNGSESFDAVFEKFFKKEGIYGFGDTQLKTLYDKVIFQN